MVGDKVCKDRETGIDSCGLCEKGVDESASWLIKSGKYTKYE